MARTPEAPAVKEIKPTAAISWKAIAQGPIRRAGLPVLRSDALRPLPISEAFEAEVEADAWTTLEEPLEGVYVDSGENGLFAASEFETLTALGLMEFVTPEEIAENVIREIRGIPSVEGCGGGAGRGTMGPTYRAGILRSAGARADGGDGGGVRGTAWGLVRDARPAPALEAPLRGRHPQTTSRRRWRGGARTRSGGLSERARALIEEDADLRQRILSIGLPILLPDGETLLRGPRVKVLPEEGESVDLQVLVDRGWVDLGADNWLRWRDRFRGFRDDVASRVGLESGSRGDHEYGDAAGAIRPGRMGAWIFRYEDRGERIKR
jgi:hypothetical protein